MRSILRIYLLWIHLLLFMFCIRFVPFLEYVIQGVLDIPHIQVAYVSVNLGGLTAFVP